MNTNLISHLGTIKSIDKKNLIVKIISQTACSACHAKSACTSADQTVKEIEIQQEEGGFQIGEEVLVLTTFYPGLQGNFLRLSPAAFPNGYQPDNTPVFY